jgi:hypothetical protein
MILKVAERQPAWKPGKQETAANTGHGDVAEATDAAGIPY